MPLRGSVYSTLRFYNQNHIPLKACFASTNNEEDTKFSTILSQTVEKLNPIKYYNNFKEDLPQIKKDQSNKTGVYCLLNLINGHIYIGSSVNIAIRMKNYSNAAFLKHKKNKNMPIIQALLKYGQEHFAVLIVEHVSSKQLTIRETLYIMELLPYYNVLKQGYSSLGYKHTEATKHMLSELAKNRKHSEKTKSLISKALVGENNPFYNKNHSFESKIRMIEANSAYPVYIYNSFKILLFILPSVKTLAKLINSNHATIVNYIKKGESFRGEWYITNLPYHISSTPLIKSRPSEEFDELISDMIKNKHIKKAIFVYKSDPFGQAIEFINKFEGVTHAQKELNIHHLIIKKHALNNISYKNLIFSYERLQARSDKSQ
jgi:group I intron endonuclease